MGSAVGRGLGPGGDIDALREAAPRLARINAQLGGDVDMEAQTDELLRNLLPRSVTRAR